MEQKLTFTAYLQDQYTKKFDALAQHSDEKIRDIAKNLDSLSTSGKKAARSIDEIEKRIQVLSKAKKFTIDTSAIKFANQEIKALEKEKSKLEGNSGGGMFGGMGAGLAIGGGLIAAAAMAKSGIQKSLEASMEREQQRISFGVLTGSQGKGDALLNDIKGMAAATPFETNDLTKATQTLLGFGVAQEKVLPIMHQLGDISGGNKERFDALTLAYAQMSSTGRLMGQDLLQMVNAGFNPLNEMSKQTGKSMAILKKEMEKGAISADMVTNAISRATSEGGKYFGMMDKQSQTTAGRLSTLTDNTHELAVTMGDRLKPGLDSAITGLGNLIINVRGWIDLKSYQKTEKDIESLHLLKIQLNDTNISEVRRKELLKELNDNYSTYLGNLNLEKDGYEKIQTAIDNAIESLKQKRQVEFQQNILKEAQDKLGTYTVIREQAYQDILPAITKYAPELENLKTDDVSRVKMLKDIIQAGVKGGRISKADYYGIPGISNGIKDNMDSFFNLDNLLTKKEGDFNNLSKGVSKRLGDIGYKPKKESLAKAGGTIGSGSDSTDTSLGSISGGSKITHLNITIGSLVSGGITVQSTNVKEGAAKIKDHITEALLTAVNDANLAAN